MILKNIDESKKITVARIMETTYEDGTSWIEYRYDNKWGYEICNIAEEGMEEITEEAYNKNIELYTKATNKKQLKECSEMLASWIEECRQSDNEMWFIDSDEIEEENIDVEKVLEEVEKLGIRGYVEYDEYGQEIVVYGGVITKFLF